MADLDLNEQQKLAVCSDERNIVVAASAGTGKTTVLVDRVMKKVLEGKADMDSLLILTFTKAAAQNMKDRLEAALRKRERTEEDADERNRLLQQIDKLQTADISTIDSYINKLVRKYSYRLDIDPEYQILSSDIARNRLRDQVYDQVIEDFEAGEEKDRKLMFQLMTGNNQDKNLKKALFGLYDFLGSIEDRDAWMKKAEENSLEERIFSKIERNKEKFRELADHLELYGDDLDYCQSTPTFKNIARNFIVLKNVFKTASTAASLAEIEEEFNKVDRNRLTISSGNLKNFGGNEKYKGVPPYLDLSEAQEALKNKDIINKSGAYRKALKEADIEQFKEDRDVFEKAIPAYKHVLEVAENEFNAKPENECANKTLDFSMHRMFIEEVEKPGGILEYLNGKLENPKEKFNGDFPNIKKTAWLEKFVDSKDPVMAADYDAANSLYLILSVNPSDLFSQQQAVKNAFLDLYDRFSRAYEERKEELNLFEYSDLSKKVLELLKDDEVAGEIGRGLKEIIVDECQDTNGLQNGIFERISEAGGNVTRFSVGDVKQSIYRFRQADYTVFNGMRRQADDEITLKSNYRSRRRIIDEINGLFENIMKKEDDEGQGIDYFKEELEYSGMYEEYEKLPEEEKLTPYEEVFLTHASDMTGSETLAAEIISRIESIMKNKSVYDRRKKEIRPAKYSDFAVIVRSWSQSECYFKAFKNAGIPYRVSRSDSFLKKPEIMIATSYLKALEDNRDDISLVALLRSPLYCVNERELAFLRTLQHGSFYGLIYRFRNEHETEEGRSRLENAAEELGLEIGFIETLNEKLDKFAEEFEMLSSLAYTTSPSDLVNFILSETDIVSVFSALPQGSGRRANLNGLAGYVRELEDSGMTSLSEVNEALESDRNLDEVNENVDENVVTFTTIHGSKGLEFPVVFLSETQSSENHNNNPAVIRRDGLFFKSLRTEELEEGIRDYTTDNTLLKVAGLNDEEESEKKRLLYVAMTRAEQSLQVMAYGNNPKNDSSNKSSKPKESKSFLDLICAAKGYEKPEFSAPGFEKSEKAGNSVVPDDPAFDGERTAFAVSDADLISPATAVKKMFSKTGGVTCRTLHYKGEEETEDERVPADALGTAVHLIFEKLDLGSANKAQVEKTAEELCRKGFFSEAVLDVIKDTFIDGIAALYRTKAGRELRQSEDVRREFPITVLVNAEPEEGSDDYTIVHGIIDAMYRNPDGRWVLIDYKTDINLSCEKVLKENYDGQLRLYAKALEAMGEQVESCYLYGVRHHDLFKVEKGD